MQHHRFVGEEARLIEYVDAVVHDMESVRIPYRSRRIGCSDGNGLVEDVVTDIGLGVPRHAIEIQPYFVRRRFVFALDVGIVGSPYKNFIRRGGSYRHGHFIIILVAAVVIGLLAEKPYLLQPVSGIVGIVVIDEDNRRNPVAVHRHVYADGARTHAKTAVVFRRRFSENGYIHVDLRGIRFERHSGVRADRERAVIERTDEVRRKTAELQYRVGSVIR